MRLFPKCILTFACAIWVTPAASADTALAAEEMKEILTGTMGWPAGVVRILDPDNLPDFALGDTDAEIYLVKYHDFKCTSCKALHLNALRRVKKRYVEGGAVRLFSGIYPMDQRNPESRGAALAAISAANQGEYWHMVDVLFQNQRRLSDGVYPRLARAVGLDVDRFLADFGSEAVANRLDAEKKKAEANGVRGTPLMYIGKMSADGKLVAIRLPGPAPYSDILLVIEAMQNEI